MAAIPTCLCEEQDRLPEFFLCPITLEVMEDPVIAADGVTYERTAIEAWMARRGAVGIYRTPLTSRDLHPNRALKAAIEFHIQQVASLQKDASDKVDQLAQSQPAEGQREVQVAPVVLGPPMWTQYQRMLVDSMVPVQQSNPLWMWTQYQRMPVDSMVPVQQSNPTGTPYQPMPANVPVQQSDPHVQQSTPTGTPSQPPSARMQQLLSQTQQHMPHDTWVPTPMLSDVPVQQSNPTGTPYQPMPADVPVQQSYPPVQQSTPTGTPSQPPSARMQQLLSQTQQLRRQPRPLWEDIFQLLAQLQQGGSERRNALEKMWAQPPSEASARMKQLYIQELRTQLKQGGSPRRHALLWMQGQCWRLSLDSEGTWAVQEALEVAQKEDAQEEEKALVKELLEELYGKVHEASTHRHANYVMQKVVKCWPDEEVVLCLWKELGKKVCTHPIACRIARRFLERFGASDQSKDFRQSILQHFRALVKDTFGNYVVQTLLKEGEATDKQAIAVMLTNDVLAIAQSQYGSLVMECALFQCRPDDVKSLKAQLLSQERALVQSEYGRYVVEKVKMPQNERLLA